MMVILILLKRIIRPLSIGGRETANFMKFSVFFYFSPLRVLGSSGLVLGLLLMCFGTIISAIYGYIKKDYFYFKILLKTDAIILAIILLIFIFHFFN